MQEEFTVAQVANFCGCHRCTVLNYENRGYIRSLRDCNNFRRFPRREAKKLKEILSIRKPSNGNHNGRSAASYERGASFRAWAHSTTMEGGSLRSRLMKERKDVIEEIDWNGWDPEQSKRLALLDHLLGI